MENRLCPVRSAWKTRRSSTLSNHKGSRIRLGHRTGRDGSGDEASQWCIDNRYFRAAANDFVQIDDIAGAHSNASVTHRQTNVPFLRCAVNVNVPSKGVCVLRLASTQPENAGDDRIATGRIWRNDFACATAIFEYRARRGIVTDFFCDLQLAQWSTTAAWPIAQTKLGR